MSDLMLSDDQFEELKQVILDMPPPVQIINVDAESICIIEYEGILDHEHIKGLEKHFSEITKTKRCIVLSSGMQLKQVLQTEQSEDGS